MQLSRIISGGQTGADRAALDVAIKHGILYGGWCPKGGWAEDMSDPPGLLEFYPKLRETPSHQPAQRTEWNVRDSSATLIILKGPIERSPGTMFTRHIAQKLDRPFRIVLVSEPPADTLIWLDKNLRRGVLNVAGPRESHEPGLYEGAKAFLERLLTA